MHSFRRFAFLLSLVLASTVGDASPSPKRVTLFAGDDSGQVDTAAIIGVGKDGFTTVAIVEEFHTLIANEGSTIRTITTGFTEVDTRTVSIKGNSVYENFAELFIKCSIAPDHKSEGCTEFLQDHGPQTTSPLSSWANTEIDTLVVDDKITKLPAPSTTVFAYPSGSSFPSVASGFLSGSASGSHGSIVPSQTPAGQLNQQTSKGHSLTTSKGVVVAVIAVVASVISGVAQF